eukprot:CAMPEP_0174275856 /NCGR_PEP_ID=MMETSP0439-20130205/60067_1 /TAXON_ID=0 /ORGANISM="Stereomyxa ramosa, Strain Chinc5" /LENGTH=1280 /DNA_ID=CAMNT_0015368027 /DNA_START=30 /DNA_END=3869 /DNA_ORIENTATION=-
MSSSEPVQEEASKQEEGGEVQGEEKGKEVDVEFQQPLKEAVLPKKNWQVEGEWEKGVSDGGCFNHVTWWKNPQFFLTVAQDSAVTITLTQTGASQNAIGFYILESDGTGRKILYEGDQYVVGKSSFGVSKQVTTSLQIPANEYPYVLMPCTFESNKQGTFSIEVTSNEDVILESCSPERSWLEAHIDGAWKGETAGGCKNFDTFLNNPQYILTVGEGQTTAHIILQQLEDPDFDTLGVYIVSSNKSAGDAKKLVLVNNEDIVLKAPFTSPDEVSLKITLNVGSYVIIPCTFDPEQEAPFTLDVLSDKPVHLKELGAIEAITLQGEWTAHTAGGCMNHTSWRDNNQYFIYAHKDVDFTLKLKQIGGEESIGFYILTSSKGKRRTVVKKEHLVFKSGFYEQKEVSQEVGLAASKYPYILIPCSFDPGYCSKFTISVYPKTSDDEENLQFNLCDDFLLDYSLPGEWKGITAAGCMNYCTWRNNPQFFFSHQLDGQFTFLLSQPKNPQDQKSIGFYVVKKSGNSKLWSVEREDIVAKGAFRKQKEVFCTFDSKGGSEYAIIPCLFRPGWEGEFTLRVFSSCSEDETITFERAPDNNSSSVVLGEWDEATSGGCLNFRTWVSNPHYSLTVTKPVKASLVLVQYGSGKDLNLDGDEMQYEAIGIYINEGDKWGFPKIELPENVVAKSDFENSQDVYVDFFLEPSENPYIVTPCTFNPGVESEFYLQIFHDAEDTDSVILDVVDYGAYLQYLEGQQRKTSELTESDDDKKKEKEKEKEEGGDEKEEKSEAEEETEKEEKEEKSKSDEEKEKEGKVTEEKEGKEDVEKQETDEEKEKLEEKEKESDSDEKEAKPSEGDQTEQKKKPKKETEAGSADESQEKEKKKKPKKETEAGSADETKEKEKKKKPKKETAGESADETPEKEAKEEPQKKSNKKRRKGSSIKKRKSVKRSSGKKKKKGKELKASLRSKSLKKRRQTDPAFLQDLGPGKDSSEVATDKDKVEKGEAEKKAKDTGESSKPEKGEATELQTETDKEKEEKQRERDKDFELKIEEIKGLEKQLLESKQFNEEQENKIEELLRKIEKLKEKAQEAKELEQQKRKEQDKEIKSLREKVEENGKKISELLEEKKQNKKEISELAEILKEVPCPSCSTHFDVMEARKKHKEEMKRMEEERKKPPPSAPPPPPVVLDCPPPQTKRAKLDLSQLNVQKKRLAGALVTPRSENALPAIKNFFGDLLSVKNKLKSANSRVLPPKTEKSEGIWGFNMEKIASRRNAMEFSDEESDDEEW